jgi:transcriptional regulator GlxA family with amidase domain
VNEGTDRREPRRIGFLLIDGFPLIALASALDPLRGANDEAQARLYDWCMISADGRAVRSSSDIAFPADAGISEQPRLTDLFVVAGASANRYRDPAVTAWLRRIERDGCRFGAISGGAYLLARAGLLEGRRFAIHWDLQPAFAEEFPRLCASPEVFVIDGRCLTCAGGTTALDLMLWLIANDHGWEMALRVAEQFIYPQIRDSHDRQRQSPQERFGVNHQRLAKAIEVMERNIETSLTSTELAARAGLSQRQLERLFRKYLHATPTRFYAELFFNDTATTEIYTTIPVIEVALACGFGSHSHFTRIYREHFGVTPKAERDARRLYSGEPEGPDRAE